MSQKTKEALDWFREETKKAGLKGLYLQLAIHLAEKKAIHKLQYRICDSLSSVHYIKKKLAKSASVIIY